MISVDDTVGENAARRCTSRHTGGTIVDERTPSLHGIVSN